MIRHVEKPIALNPFRVEWHGMTAWSIRNLNFLCTALPVCSELVRFCLPPLFVVASSAMQRPRDRPQKIGHPSSFLLLSLLHPLVFHGQLEIICSAFDHSKALLSLPFALIPALFVAVRQVVFSGSSISYRSHLGA